MAGEFCMKCGEDCLMPCFSSGTVVILCNLSGNMRFFFFLSFLFTHVQLKQGYDLLWNIDGIVTDHLCLQINMHYHRSSVLLLGMILE